MIASDSRACQQEYYQDSESQEIEQWRINSPVSCFLPASLDAGFPHSRIPLDDKIWIHRDGTEDGVATELLDAGVPKDKVVLGFRSPEMRKYTGLAIA